MITPGAPLSQSLATADGAASTDTASHARGRLSPALLMGALGVMMGVFLDDIGRYLGAYVGR